MSTEHVTGANGRNVPTRLAAIRKSPAESKPLTTVKQLNAMLRWTGEDAHSGRFRTLLYRFLARHIPSVRACLWTWVRLVAAPGRFEIVEGPSDAVVAQATQRLEELSERLYVNRFGKRHDLTTLQVELATCLFRDGLFGGFLTVQRDASGVDGFLPVDPIDIVRKEDRTGRSRLVLDCGETEIDLDRPDFHYETFGSDIAEPMGCSLLQAIPFVAYIEQQLIDDMRRSSHNAGFHRLHVKVTPPERMAGESEQAYLDRINSYFDTTVSMIRSCEVDDNPVTWDNIQIEYIGPENARSLTSSWFLNHRAMIEEVCGGTNLAPFLLGYSFGATNTWSQFKFDLVMRQAESLQRQFAHFLEWVGNVHLALSGLSTRCRFVCDNSFAYQAGEQAEVAGAKVESLLKLYQAGLVDDDRARDAARGLVRSLR